MKKPLYGKVLVSKSFRTREEAEDFSKDMKREYKEAELSLRYDVQRSEEGRWTSTVYAKID